MTSISYLDPLENETAKAYAAFCVYRDMGSNRSIDTAYRENTSKVGRANKVWVDWSVKYGWVERAKQYDAYLANKARELREVEHLADLNEYRTQLAQSSKAALATGQKALKLSMERMNAMTAKDIPVKSLPAFVRAANDTIEKAVDGWGMALSVDELITLLGAIDDD